jgi:hypothetical protein
LLVDLHCSNKVIIDSEKERKTTVELRIDADLGLARMLLIGQVWAVVVRPMIKVLVSCLKFFFRRSEMKIQACLGKPEHGCAKLKKRMTLDRR